MSLRTLNGYIKKHGKAKTAVALGLTETSAINNWIARKSIPKERRDNVRALKEKVVCVLEKGETIKPADA
jgi:hypothetical protein